MTTCPSLYTLYFYDHLHHEDTSLYIATFQNGFIVPDSPTYYDHDILHDYHDPSRLQKAGIDLDSARELFDVLDVHSVGAINMRSRR